jgi:hypothetical protein
MRSQPFDKIRKSIVITEGFARELFGDKEALGETVTIGESGQ